MEKNSFDEGIEPGGLREADDIKILICYLLNAVAKPLTFDNLNEILQHDGLCNYFEFANALHEMLISGHVDLVKKDGCEYYKVTRLGAGTAGMFERRLPLTIREKAVKSAIKLLAKLKRESENNVSIEKVKGGYSVECSVYDMGDTLLSVKLLVPDTMQADSIKKQFLKSPEILYRGVVGLLTGDTSPNAPTDNKE